jgi:hypothetical protein
MKFTLKVLFLAFIFNTYSAAESPDQEQINAVLEKLRKEEIVEAAQNQSKSIVLNCPAGMPRGKTEDLAEFIAKHQLLQEKTSKELEDFKAQRKNKNESINSFNNAANEFNLITRWGKGKASDVCFSKTLLHQSGIITDATKIIIEAFRSELMKSK